MIVKFFWTRDILRLLEITVFTASCGNKLTLRKLELDNRNTKVYFTVSKYPMDLSQKLCDSDTYFDVKIRICSFAV